jgi:hypothetical protein
MTLLNLVPISLTGTFYETPLNGHLWMDLTFREQFLLKCQVKVKVKSFRFRNELIDYHEKFAIWKGYKCYSIHREKVGAVGVYIK